VNKEEHFERRSAIEEALQRLNARMVYAEMVPLELVACGGATLNLLGLISRPTVDVDILAVARLNRRRQVVLLPDAPLPAGFLDLVATVGRELGIMPAWLNFGPSPLLKFGLPQNVEKRLQRKSYGACLTLHLLCRFDQVALKIYAAMDPKGGERHLGDLVDIEPQRPEVEAAVKWLLNRRTGAGFRRKLNEVLERIGYEDLARKA
jgi:hypothetical protein